MGKMPPAEAVTMMVPLVPAPAMWRTARRTPAITAVRLTSRARRQRSPASALPAIRSPLSITPAFKTA